MKKLAYLIFVILTLNVELNYGQTTRGIEWITADLVYPACIVEWSSDCSDCTFELARVSDFDPCADETPVDGVFTFLSNLQNPYYDTAIWQQEPGYYAYAVREVFSGGGTSDWAFTQVLVVNIDVSLTINLTSCCNDNISDSLQIISLSGGCFDTVYYADSENGFTELPPGIYDLRIDVEGYTTWKWDNLLLNDDMELFVSLLPPVYPPRNTFVDTTSSLITWDTPLSVQLDQTFEKSQFPPGSWRAESKGIGWQRTNDGGSEGFPVPEHDSYYAIVNNDLAGNENDGCCDTLITDYVNLRYRDHFSLYFDSYFTGSGGQTATVLYSTDFGITWDSLYQLSPDTSWVEVNIDLSFLSGFYGEDHVLFAFLANDNGQSGSGWALDNVLIHSGIYYPDGFVLYSNDELIDEEIPASAVSYFIPDLMYGQDYSIYFASYQCCKVQLGLFESFTSGYLPSCENFAVNFDEDELDLSASWTVPTLNGTVAKGLTMFTLYMDNEIVGYKPFDGQGLDDTIGIHQLEIMTGGHEFCVKATYDLSDYGFPGETGESLFTCDSIFIVFTGLTDDQDQQSQINIFPNPATNQLNIESAEKIKRATLINYSGQTVLIKHFDDKNVKLNTAELEAGIYVVRVKMNNSVAYKKVVISK